MGILSSIGKHIVKKGAELGIAITGAAAGEALEKGMQKNKEKKTSKFLDDEKSGHIRLVVSQNLYKIRESFQIYDSEENVKYIVKGKLISATHNLTIYDSTGKNKLGEVKEKLISLRSPLSLESHPQDFVLYINGKKLGKIRSRFSFAKPKFKCDFNNWIIDGNFIGSKYKVTNEKKIVMEVDKKIALREDLYFVYIINSEDELLCLMIALTIDCSISSKVRDNDRAIRRNIYR